MLLLLRLRCKLQESLAKVPGWDADIRSSRTGQKSASTVRSVTRFAARIIIPCMKRTDKISRYAAEIPQFMV